MKTIAFVLYFLVCGYAAVPSAAQQRSVSLDDALVSALERNRDITVARFEVDKADAAAREALGYALPSLDVSGNFTRNLKQPVFFFPNVQTGQQEPVSIGQKNAFSATAELSQVIFNAAVFTGVSSARTWQNAAREQYKSKVMEIVTKVQQAYYAALFARSQWELSQQSLANAADNQRNVQALLNEGQVAEFDALRAEVRADNLRPQVLLAEKNYGDALNALKVLLGADIGEDIALSGSLEYNDEAVPALPELREKVRTNNYTLKAMALQNTVTKELIAVKKADYLPTVSLFGSYTYQGQADDFSFTTVSTAAAGVRFALSLYQGGQTDARVEQARVNYQQVEKQREVLEQNLQEQVVSIAGQMESARKRVEALQRTVEQAQRGNEIAKARYTSGAGTQLDIGDTELALYQAQINRLQAIYDFLVSKAQLANALGEVDERYMRTVPLR